MIVRWLMMHLFLKVILTNSKKLHLRLKNSGEEINIFSWFSQWHRHHNKSGETPKASNFFVHSQHLVPWFLLSAHADEHTLDWFCGRPTLIYGVRWDSIKDSSSLVSSQPPSLPHTHTHVQTRAHCRRTVLVIDDGGPSICKPNVEMGGQSKLCFLTPLHLPSFFLLLLPFCLLSLSILQLFH